MTNCDAVSFLTCGPECLQSKIEYRDLPLFSVLNPGEGVCANPGKGDATLGVGGPGPPERDGEHQLVPDRGGGET